MPRGGSGRPLRGYTRVSRARGGGWVSPASVRITEYEYRNRVAKKQGWTNAYQSDKFRKSQSWKKTVLDIGKAKVNYTLDEYGNETYIGPDLTYKGGTMHDAYVVQQRRLKGDLMVPEGQNTKMDETELGRVLIASGRRPSDAVWEYAA
jgi:hypothetical protein